MYLKLKSTLKLTAKIKHLENYKIYPAEVYLDFLLDNRVEMQNGIKTLESNEIIDYADSITRIH